MDSLQVTPPAGSAQDPSPAAVAPGQQAATYKPVEKAGLGGCLLYPLLFLVVQPIGVVLSLFRRPQVYVPYGYYLAGYRVHWPSVLFNVIVAVLAVLLLVLFLRKKAIVPALFVALLGFWFALATLLFLVVPPPPLGVESPARVWLVLLLQCFILIPYFTLSRRVRNTFVREPDPTSALDRQFMPLSRPATRVYGSLVRGGPRVFLLVLGFVVGVVAVSVPLGLAVQALFR